MEANDIINVIGINGNIGNISTTHLCKWRLIGAICVVDAIDVNGANGSIGDPSASLMPMESLVLLEILSLVIYWCKCRH